MRNLVLGFLLGLILAIGASGRAQDWIVSNGLAFHLDGSSHCHNHFTPGLGLEFGSYAIGFYSNSNCRWSAYAAKSWLPLQFSNVKVGAIGGVVTGYAQSILPAAGLAATFETERYGINLIYVPPFQNSGNVAWIQWKVRW